MTLYKKKIASFILLLNSFSLYTMDNTLSLHKAVSEADITSITFCLDNGIDINARGVHGETPLHIAANLHPTIDIEDISNISYTWC
jgi:ankyrin repeat protein